MRDSLINTLMLNEHLVTFGGIVYTLCQLNQITGGIMGRRLSQMDKGYIVQAYTQDLTPMIDLAVLYGITRQAVWKTIKAAGIDIKAQGVLAVSCAACGEEILRPRCRIRQTLNNFCGYECYTAFLTAGNGQGAYKPNRHGQRTARAVVSKLFDLLPGHVVHHEDRNCTHNDPGNLRVFANQGDHVRYHRLGIEYARPIWNGSE